MCDMPRHHWTAACANGARVSTSAINLCAYLWTFLSAQHRQKGGFIFHTSERLATELEVDKRTIERQLRQLRDAGLVKPARDQQSRQGFNLLVLPNSAEIADRNAEGSPIVSAEIADPAGRDRRSSVQRSPIIPAKITDTNCTRKEEQDREQEREQECEPELRARPAESSVSDLEQARTLAALASVPDGAPPLGKTRPALRTLLALLAEGEDPTTIERVLRRAADIVAAGLERSAYFGPEMFVDRIWLHWCRSLFELEQRERVAAEGEAQRAAAEATTKAAQREEADRAAIESDRQGVALICDRIRRQMLARGRVEPLQAAAAKLDAVESAIVYAPEAAQAAIDALRRDAPAGLTEPAVRGALAGLDIKPPRELTPADLREARERAGREGRSALDVLNETRLAE